LFLCDNLVLLDSGELNILNLYIFPSVRVWIFKYILALTAK
jgi:hypothetical protein